MFVTLEAMHNFITLGLLLLREKKPVEKEERGKHPVNRAIAVGPK